MRDPPFFRQVRQRAFYERGAAALLASLHRKEDRGLSVLPLGGRETVETVLMALSHQTEPGLRSSRVVLVAHGAENVRRWRGRLNALFPQRAYIREREQWSIRDMTVHLISIHELSRRGPEKQREWFEGGGDHPPGNHPPFGLMILDHEHHVRPTSSAVDRQRASFFGVLEAAGFVEMVGSGREKAVRRLKKSEAYLWGITETVSDGAGSLYGGSVLTAQTLPELRQLGMIETTEVQVEIPTRNGSEINWSTLDLDDRVLHLAEVMERYGLEGGRVRRMEVNVETTEEARRLFHFLEADSRFRGKAALITSDLSAKARHELWQEVGARMRQIVINVDLVEGVEELRDVEVVILGHVRKANSRRHGLQVVGRHLMGERPPLFIDVAGMFRRHPELVHADPTKAIMSEGEVAYSSEMLGTRGKVARRSGSSPFQVEEVLRDLFGERVGDRFPRALRRVLHDRHLREEAAAVLSDHSSEMTGALLSGAYLPSSRLMVESMARGLTKKEEEQRFLLDHLAFDRLFHCEAAHGFPSHLTKREQAVLRRVRWRWLRDEKGDEKGVEGIQATILRAYLQKG